MFFSRLIPTQLPSLRQVGWLGFISLLSITGINNAAHADDWIFAPYLRADLVYSSTVDHDGYLFDTGEIDTQNMDPNNSARFQIGAGIKLNAFLRTDITISYRDNMTEVGTYLDADGIPNKPENRLEDDAYRTSSWSTLLNVYVDPLSAAGLDTGPFSVYLQGGIGWARNKTEDLKFVNFGTIFGDTHNAFAWQVGAGVNYAITEHWKLDLSYRFVDMGEARASDFYVFNGTTLKLEGTRFDLQSHDVSIGLQYQF